jgi:DTW domain-containing protein YfiP
VPDLSRRCPRCAFPPAHCICGEIPRLASRTRVVVVRHAAERARTTSTVRWAALALERCEILDHAVRGAPLDLGRIPVRGAAVLFPRQGGPAPRRAPGPPRPPSGSPCPPPGRDDAGAPAEVPAGLAADPADSADPASPASAAARPPCVPDPAPEVLVVLDGSWAQARRMLQRLAPLRDLPRLSLPPRDAERLRRPTVAGGMSTLEAIADALELLGDGEAAGGLRAVHRLAVARGMRLRWAPGRDA